MKYRGRYSTIDQDGNLSKDVIKYNFQAPNDKVFQETITKRIKNRYCVTSINHKTEIVKILDLDSEESVKPIKYTTHEVNRKYAEHNAFHINEKQKVKDGKKGLDNIFTGSRIFKK